MTRADLNFIYEENGDKKKVLYWYHNGDQYPRGLREFYGIVKWLKNPDKFNKDGFTEWLAKNYFEYKSVAYTNPKTKMTLVDNWVKTEKIAKPEQKHFVTIDGFTDYNYVFNGVTGIITAYSWAKPIFEGTREEFIKWIKEQD